MLKQAQKKLYFTFTDEPFALCACDAALLPLIGTFQTSQFIPGGIEEHINKTTGERKSLYNCCI
jgi:hypothetical protein